MEYDPVSLHGSNPDFESPILGVHRRFAISTTSEGEQFQQRCSFRLELVRTLRGWILRDLDDVGACMRETWIEDQHAPS
jgi:hypothetical protein